MTDQELADATNALVQWFVSQDLKPFQAGEILTKLFARQIVSQNGSLEDINAAIGLHHNQLVMEVAKAMEIIPLPKVMSIGSKAGADLKSAGAPEITQEMIAAGLAETDGFDLHDAWDSLTDRVDLISRVYRAMLLARPKG